MRDFVVSVATPDGQTMLAWFQRWDQSSGGGVGPGDPIVARTAYGTEPGSLPLRQATHALYPTPERDESILLAYAGGADAFVLASYHPMWPGHSRAYRYVWKDGAWSEPLNVAENTSGWGVPYYVGAAKNTSLIRYVYNDNYVPKMHTETNGVLSVAQTVADYLSARGCTNAGSPLAYFTDAAGGLHMIVSGEKDGVAGFYYVQP